MCDESGGNVDPSILDICPDADYEIGQLPDVNSGQCEYFPPTCDIIPCSD